MSNALVLGSVSVPSPSTVRGQATKIGSHGSRIAYPAGRSAIIRTIGADKAVSETFPTASVCGVARISPSGQYLAIGETNGTVKIIDLTSEDRKVKFEFKNGGRVIDLAWDGESSRIAFCGEGKERFGAFYSLSTGTQVGEMSGHSKVVNAVALRQQRPFKAITGSDDCSTIILNGLPFKYASTMRKHSRFVQSVDYSSDGSLSLSAGSDGCVHLYSGTDGTDHSSLVDASLSTPAAHTGTIFAATFSKDLKSVLTSSADKTTKLWDIATGKVTKTWTFSREGGLGDQQVGNCFIASGGIVSISFSGDINILSATADEPVQIIRGHQQAVTALTLDASTGTLFSGDAAGTVRSWTNGECGFIAGSGHSNLVIDLVPQQTSVISIGMDDVVRKIDSNAFSNTSYATGSLPKALAHSSTETYLLTTNSLVVLSSTDLKPLKTQPLPYSATALAVSTNSTTIAIGADDGKVHLLNLASLSETGVLQKNRTAITALTFSSDNTTLAVGESSGKILLYNFTTLEMTQSRFVFHTARINSLAFDRGGERLLSGSLDSNVMVYSVKTPSKVVSAKGAHVGGVNAVLWKGDSDIATAGADACVRSWQLPG